VNSALKEFVLDKLIIKISKSKRTSKSKPKQADKSIDFNETRNICFQLMSGMFKYAKKLLMK